MKNRRNAFTIAELLAILVIVAILVAILFPVFRTAKQTALQTAWVESTRQTGLATFLYLGDYDDRYMIARYNPDENVNSAKDRTWVQAILPYTTSFQLFLNPVDDTRNFSTTIFDEDLIPGDTYSRYYQASKRSNIGYNFIYLNPMVKDEGTWTSNARTSSEINDGSNTILFGDSVWEIDNGMPQGGGNYLIVPPCRYISDSGSSGGDSFNLGGVPSQSIYNANLTWVNDRSTAQAGGLYAWFKPKVTITFASGTVKRMTMSEISAGCEVAPDWNGTIIDSRSYIWDLR